IRGVQLAVVSIAAAVSLQTLYFENVKLTDLSAGSNAAVSKPTFFGLDIGSAGDRGLTDRPAFTIFCVIVLALLCVAVCNIRVGGTGRRFLAVRANERAAAAAGIEVARTKMLAFAIASAIAGVSGVMTAFQQTQIASSAWVYFGGLAFLAFAIIGPLLTFVSTLPDMAMLRDQDPNSGDFVRRRSAYWIGSVRQWGVLRTSMFIVGPLYFITLGGVQLIYSTDFSMSLVPGWIDAIYPAYTGVTGLQAGLATLIMTMGIVRSSTGLRNYMGVDQFWGLGKLLLALTLMWFYFFFSSFIIMWYGKRPNEQAVQQLIMFGPYLLPFVISVLCNLLIPFMGILMWNRWRKSILGPVIASGFILVGNLFDRIRLYVSAFAVPNDQVQLHTLEHLPPFRPPDLADMFLIAGAVGLLAVIILGASRVVPLMSVWENKEGLLYRVAGPPHREGVGTCKTVAI
ncbi:MAG: hypothetical protein NTZ05_04750, partial [Chloroflexi bacterium]|nr:hypothetical protein [Chloroflexota bacterium]